MVGRNLIGLIVAITALALATWFVRRDREFRPRYEGSPPNVLLVSVDTLRADHMGIYGYERPTTPNLDRWARGAVVFDNAQASSSWTLPGLASVLTSYYTSTHGCWTFNSRLDSSFLTFPEILRDAGYDTMAVTSHVFLVRRYGLQQGFIHFDGDFSHTVADQRRTVTSEIVSERGIRFLEQKAAAADGVPWLMWLHYFDPHEAYMPHAGISEQFGTTELDGEITFTELDLYDGEITFTDRHIGRVLDSLERLGLAEDTIVVFFSDHGEEFLDHGALRHGHSLYGELVRVPLVVRVPGVEPRRVDDLVSMVDVFPTILERVPPLVSPADIEGMSLGPLLEGRPGAERSAVAETRLSEQNSLDCILRGRWKLIVDSIEGDVELYDLGSDPAESRDVADEFPEVVADLKQELRGVIAKAQERSRLYEHSGELELTPTQLDQMKDLGYLGDDDEEEE